MPSKNDPNLAAVSYARPLLELAQEQNQLKQVGEELGQIAQIIEQNKTFALYLSDPAVGHDERKALLTKLFGGKVTPLLQNFIGLLNQRDKLQNLPAIAQAYADLVEKQMGNIEIDVTTAQKLSAEQLESVRQKVSTALGKNAIVEQHVDESILGGLIVRVEDKLIDASVKYQLQAMKEQLLAATPR